MFNVNELTSRLAKMSDPQLRQYAQMHKDDPYTLALAAAENKRRAQLRGSGQQQAPQPTVAEQTIAQMGAPAPMPQQAQPQPQLPEQQGIGMLPAENVEGMADGGIAGYDDQFVDSYADAYAGGGIVAFDNGGTVPSFDMTGGSTTAYGTNTSDVFAPRAAPEETSSPVGRFFSGLAPEGARARYDAQQAKLAKERELMNRLQQLEGYGFAQQTREQQAEAAKVRQQLNALQSERPAAPATNKPAAQTARDSNTPVPPPKTEPPKTEPPVKKDKVNSPFADTGPGRKATSQQPGAATSPDFVPGKAGNLADELKRLQGMNPGTKDYDKLLKDIEAGYAKLDKEREAGKPKDKAHAGLEALLGKEEEKAKGKEARNFNMSLVNAGLAIAGGKSQYALQNIAEGAQVGTKQYQEGLDKLEAAALERRKQAAMIEEARRAEARGDWKENAEFKRKAFESGLGVKQAQISAVQDLYKTDLKTATDLVTNLNIIAGQDRRSMFEQTEQTKRTRETNAAHLAGQTIMAKAYGARSGGNPVNLAVDNATALLKIWQSTPDGRMATPQQLQAAYDQFYTQEAKKMGLPTSGPATDPYANWGNLQVTPGKK